MDALDTLRHPEDTGENRCGPCPAVNAALRDERRDWHHRWSGDAVASPLPAVTFSDCRELTNNSLPKSVELVKYLGVKPRGTRPVPPVELSVVNSQTYFPIENLDYVPEPEQKP